MKGEIFGFVGFIALVIFLFFLKPMILYIPTLWEKYKYDAMLVFDIAVASIWLLVLSFAYGLQRLIGLPSKKR